MRSSACVCCHDSAVDPRAANWDISKGKIWTDQLDKYAVEIMTGRVSSAALGAYKPEENFGFNRYHTGLPTTDVERMKKFFTNIADDLGTTQEEIAQMPPLASFLANQLLEEAPQCSPGVGVNAETGIINWGKDEFGFPDSKYIPARFIYVLEDGAQTPVVTPNLDKPKGTLWRIDADSRWYMFKSGSVKYGQTPLGATQTIPDPDRFERLKPLEIGKRYRLVVQLDVGFPITNCYFNYGEL